ncbi:hypothetical protein ACSNOI_29310, partial [Actinomadura kijaniata]|uniref:hypothetical protein n=1 Tax=Actinomadura kijaniata TaxID=46161 RepID=UPI003F1944EF
HTRRRASGRWPCGPALPAYQAGEMGLETGGRLRQECWNSLGEAVRGRLQQHAGTTIDWFAQEDSSSGDGRCHALLFGDRGLAIAEPRVNTEHRPVYVVSAFLFDPGSLRHLRVDHRPPPGGGAWTAPGAPSGGGPDTGLTAAAQRLVGNLPPRAQELLLTPFVTGQRALRCDWYYQGHAHKLDVFVLYLAGAKDVTVATGTKIVPAGHDDATAHWSLTCYRASVTKRIGR